MEINNYINLQIVKYGSMNLDSVITPIVMIAVAVFFLGVILRLLKQPYVVIYILAGVIIGPFGFGLVRHDDIISQLGSLGIVLLLFFVGMHISLPRILSNWKVAIIGTSGQILVSVGLVWLIGNFLTWDISRIVLMGFVISLSSTALVVKVLEDWDEFNTRIGQNALVITIVQDFAVIPMFIILDVLSSGVNARVITFQVIGSAIILALAFFSIRGNMRLPLANLIRGDHELQVFVALILCFGLALLTSFFGISPAMGAFVAGIMVSQMKETSWVQSRLESLQVIFVALFFIYVGTMIDVIFLWDNLFEVLLLVPAVFLTNTLISACILRFLGSSWGASIYTGSVLSQIGEFSFLLGAIGFERGIISGFAYQLTIATIAITLLLTPFWILMVRKLLGIDNDILFRIMNKPDPVYIRRKIPQVPAVKAPAASAAPARTKPSLPYASLEKYRFVAKPSVLPALRLRRHKG